MRLLVGWGRGLFLESVDGPHVQVHFVFPEDFFEVGESAGEGFHFGEEALDELSVGLNGTPLPGAPLDVHGYVGYVLFGTGTNVVPHEW